MAKASGSSAPAARAAGSGSRTRKREGIDFSDIPELSVKELRAMRRVGRPPLGSEARELIAIRIDPDVLQALKLEAARHRIGYQTLINEVLARHTKRRRAQ